MTEQRTGQGEGKEKKTEEERKFKISRRVEIIRKVRSVGNKGATEKEVSGVLHRINTADTA